MPFEKAISARIVFPMFDSADTRLLKTGLTVAANISKDGGLTALATNAVAEIGTTGMYTLVLTIAEMTADLVAAVARRRVGFGAGYAMRM